MQDSEEENIKLPPHSVEAEQAVIGAALVRQETLYQTGRLLKPSDFYVPQHRLIWEAIQELWGLFKRVCAITVCEKLKEKKQLEKVGDRSYIHQVEAAIVRFDNLPDYAELVRKYSARRQLIGLNRAAAREAFESDDIEATISKLITSSARLESGGTNGGVPSLADIMPTTMQELERRMKNKGCMTGVPSGIYDLDEKIFGFQPGEFVIIGARPSMGKSCLALNMAYAQAKQYNLRSLLTSLEMYKEDLALRLLATASSFDAKKFKTGKIEGYEKRDELDPYAEILKGLPIHIVDQKEGITCVQDIVAKIEEMKLRGILPDAVYVDYIQLLKSKGDSQTRELEVSEISRTLQQCAAKYGIVIFGICQLSRAVEARQNKRPMLSDLRESGSLEQDASIVIFIYRDEFYYPETSTSRGEAELIIAKNRNGEIGTVHTYYKGERQQFISKGGNGEFIKLLDKETQAELPALLFPEEVDATLRSWEKAGGVDHVEERLATYLAGNQAATTVDDVHIRNWTALSEKWETIKTGRAIAEADDLSVFYQ